MQTLLHFVKFHALGNDFVILDRLRQGFFLDAAVVRAMAHRRTGIGFDQLLVLEPPLDGNHDFSYQIYNANGSLAMQCFNGLRALAHYALDMGYSKRKKLRFQIRDLSLQTDFISTSVTKVSFTPQASIGFEKLITVDGLQFYHVNTGNDHLIQWVDEIKISRTNYLRELKQKGYDLDTWNISFAQQLKHDEVALETFERGVGRTLCCGSAALATLLALQEKQRRNKEPLTTQLKIIVPQGYLTAQHVPNSREPSFSLIGPVTRVFQGTFALKYE